MHATNLPKNIFKKNVIRFDQQKTVRVLVNSKYKLPKYQYIIHSKIFPFRATNNRAIDFRLSDQCKGEQPLSITGNKNKTTNKKQENKLFILFSLMSSIYFFLFSIHLICSRNFN